MRDLTFCDGPMLQRLMSNKEICQGIVICTNDFLRTGLPVSTLEISCIEQPSFDCEHDFRWVILDASKWSSLESGPLRRLFQFVDTGTVPHDDVFLSLISKEMDAANADAA